MIINKKTKDDVTNENDIIQRIEFEEYCTKRSIKCVFLSLLLKNDDDDPPKQSSSTTPATVATPKYTQHCKSDTKSEQS